MSWGEQVFRYCERGQDVGLFAEPLNVASNLAFLVVAGIAARRLRHARAREAAGKQSMPPETLALASMIALVALIGLGSLVFHVTATRWAQIADVAPITAFMVLYLAFALRALLCLRWPWVALGTAAFAAALGLAVAACSPSEGDMRLACLNGGAAYVPALLALAGVGGVLGMRGHAAGPRLLSAAAVFLVSLVMRTADLALCPATGLVFARPPGLHFLWHILNAVALHLLLEAAAAPDERKITLR